VLLGGIGAVIQLAGFWLVSTEPSFRFAPPLLIQGAWLMGVGWALALLAGTLALRGVWAGGRRLAR
jgi:hypothetical protein